ncbi:MAG: TonB-dependent receptor [Verrucomicrobia bacterium]|nr:TonB-dependent receptor [Verrucomicrobiota bacterium]
MSRLAAQSALPTKATSATEPETVRLERVEVEAKADERPFDPTGLGSNESQLHDAPFSNDLVMLGVLDDDTLASEMKIALAPVANPAAVDLATGDTRLSLRGFPAPLLRDGFVHLGVPDLLNTARLVVIQGALVPVLGRAAPGGIQDYQTARPRVKAGRTFYYAASSLQRQAAQTELTGPAVPKRAWQRFAADWSRKTGPERFVVSETRSADLALAWKHSATASSLGYVDFQQLKATPTYGVPEFRRATGQKVVGPYLPFAYFNTGGPQAGVRRRSTMAGVLFDAQPNPNLTVRAAVEGWWRRVEQDRFTTSLYNLTTRLFEGTREPIHVEQPQHATSARFDLTRRFTTERANHKIMFAAADTWGTYEREERALATADRNALPLTVRQFRAEAPDYYRPAFSRARYNRLITDREEKARYTSLEASERAAFDKGRLVLTAGLRQDFVALRVSDRRPGNTMPHVEDTVGQMTYLTGVNYQARPSRLLLFATTSTAFEPSTRVDARTGRIQGTDTTHGYEAGFKSRIPEWNADWSGSAFTLVNQDISRRNPLLNDPIHDANQTQPQLVAAGEEKFTGWRVEGRWKPAPPWTLAGRFSCVRAITTASPDIPEEVGRQLTRMPPINAGVSASYAFNAKGPFPGAYASLIYTYVDAYTAYYEDRNRFGLKYPSDGQVAVGLSRSFVTRKIYSHSVALYVRNALDRDLLASHARPGQWREVTGSYRLSF